MSKSATRLIPSAKSRSPGRPRKLERDSIVDAAIALADEQGPDSLSMRALAKHLGVNHATLFNYFDSADEVQAAAIERLYAEIPPLPPASAGPEAFRQQLIDNLLSLFSIQQQHPHAIQAPIGSPAWRNTFSRMNEVMGSVREFCDSDTQAWYALHLLFSAVATSAEAERLNRQSPLREKQRESLKEMPLENKASLLPIIEQHAHLDESQRFVKLIDHAICHLIPALARSGNRLEEEPHET